LMKYQILMVRSKMIRILVFFRNSEKVEKENSFNRIVNNIV